MIRLRNLERSYPLGHGQTFYVLRDINLDVTEGDFQGLNVGAPQVPAVTETNIGDGTLGGPTNIGGAEGNPGPEVTPPDAGAQDCNSPDKLWTPNC